MDISASGSLQAIRRKEGSAEKSQDRATWGMEEMEVGGYSVDGCESDLAWECVTAPVGSI